MKSDERSVSRTKRPRSNFEGLKNRNGKKRVRVVDAGPLIDEKDWKISSSSAGVY